MLSTLVAATEHRLDLARLCRGLAHGPADIARTRAIVPWDEFTIFLDRFVEMVGGMEAFERIVAKQVSAPWVRHLAGLCISPRFLCLHLAPWLTRRLYPGMGDLLTCEELADGRIAWNASLPEQGRPSAAWFRATLVVARLYPTFLGLPEAIIEAVATTRTLRCAITLPKSKTVIARAAQALRGRPTPLANDVPLGLDMLLDEPFPLGDLEFQRSRWKSHWKLSEREGHVLELIAGGGTNKEVALSLALSVKTVEKHIANLMRKVGAENRTHLVSKVLRLHDLRC
jgi:DNA-binding CsgD family transcriptional regulator